MMLPFSKIILLFSAVTVSITSGSASRAQIQIPKRVSSGDDIVIKCHIDYPSESEAKSVEALMFRETVASRSKELVSTGNEIKHGDPRYSISIEHFDRSPHTDYKLFIRDVRRADSGRYYCEVNRYGWHAEGELTVN